MPIKSFIISNFFSVLDIITRTLVSILNKKKDKLADVYLRGHRQRTEAGRSPLPLAELEKVGECRGGCHFPILFKEDIDHILFLQVIMGRAVLGNGAPP